MEELLLGNAWFSANTNSNLFRQLAEQGQNPVAAVITCSDSSVPVEVIFNQLEPGKLFVIRVAGNIIADTSVKGSIEYAVEHLKVPKLVILGHTGCGVVKACLDKVKQGELGKLVSCMKLRSKDYSEAVPENVARQVASAFDMEAVHNAVARKKLDVYGAVYDLATGRVKVMSRNGISA